MSISTVGIRKLRQNLSQQISRIQAGEYLIVTDHNKPVATLSPFPDSGHTLQQLIASAQATPATNAVPFKDIIPVDIGDLEAGTKALNYMRGESTHH